MAFDTTLNPERTNRSGMPLQHEELQRAEESAGQTAQQTQTREAQGVACPHCGTVNEPEAVYCASCGQPMHSANCPFCGSQVDLDADYCESCHRYIRTDLCSFCGARLAPGDAFCPECGQPKGGVVCPTCHTLNDFSFCKQCGTPLTDEARMVLEQIRQQPEYRQMVMLAKEYNELSMQLPYTSERDVMREDANNVLRERVLKLLAQDHGVAAPMIEPSVRKRMTKETLDQKKAEVMDKLSMMLDGMALPAQASAAKARTYAMAQKPAGVRLAWQCNYKHAMHSSPCGCAKPQLGGKWIILGHNSQKEIKDDK